MDDTRLPLWVYNYNAQNDFMRLADTDTRLSTPIPAAVPIPCAHQVNHHQNQSNIQSITSKATGQPSNPMAILYPAVNKVSQSVNPPIISSVPSKSENERQRWKLELCHVRAQLDHIVNGSNRKPNDLIETLASHQVSESPRSGDWSTVPEEGRLEILSACVQVLDLDFWRAWGADKNGLRLLEAWLKGSVCAHREASANSKNSSRDQDQERDLLLIKLLKVLPKVPLTVENLITYKFGHQVSKIAEDSLGKFSTNARELAKRLKTQWRQAAGLDKPPPNEVPENDHVVLSDTKRSNDHLPQQGPDNLNKVKLATTTVPKVPKFFVPRKKLKVLASHSTNTMLDPFAEAMQALRKVKDENSSGFLSPPIHGPNETKTKRKSVTFAPDDQLCAIKIVERLVYHQYDDDSEDHNDSDPHFVADIRQMDANEGQYLQNAEDTLQEDIDWQKPSEVVTQTVNNLKELDRPPPQFLEAKTGDPRGKVFEHHKIETTERSDGSSPNPLSDEPKLMKLGGDLLTDHEVQRAIDRAHPELLIARVRPNGIPSHQSPHQKPASATEPLSSVGISKLCKGQNPREPESSEDCNHKGLYAMPSLHNPVAKVQVPNANHEDHGAIDRAHPKLFIAHVRSNGIPSHQSPHHKPASASEPLSSVGISKSCKDQSPGELESSEDCNHAGLYAMPSLHHPLAEAQVPNANQSEHMRQQSKAVNTLGDRQQNRSNATIQSDNRIAKVQVPDANQSEPTRQQSKAVNTLSDRAQNRSDATTRSDNRIAEAQPFTSQPQPLAGHDSPYCRDQEGPGASQISQTLGFRDRGSFEHVKEFPRRRSLPGPMSSSRRLRPKGSNARSKESRRENHHEHDRGAMNHSARSTGNDRRTDYPAARHSSDRYELPPRPSSQAGRSYTSQRHHDPKFVPSRGYTRHGDHIKCKWWPDCRLGSSCVYKHDR